MSARQSSMPLLNV